MEKQRGKETRKSSRKRGCLISALIVLALFVYAFWQIGEPNRRAKRVHQAIHPNMNVSDVENLLTGRHYCFYQVMKDDDWRSVSREDFMAALAGQTASPHVSTRLQLTFMGMSPGRVSFFVEIDNNGNVSKITDPYGWD